MGLHQVKKLLHSQGTHCHNKETANRIGGSCSLDKGLISRTDKRLRKLTTKRRNNAWVNELNRQFLLTNKYKEHHSTPLAIIEMSVKMTLRCHLTPVRLTTI
jgi:hypothetical protein